MPAAFFDPIPGLYKTLISTGFVVANGHRTSAVLAADEGVADQAFDRAHCLLHIGLVLLQ